MGFFDSLFNSAKEIIDGSRQAVENIQCDMEQDSSERYDHPSEPLPAAEVHTVSHGKDVVFMLSGDFTEHGGYTSSAVSFKYDPEHLSVLEWDDENEMTVSLLEGTGDFDEITECIEEYLSGGTPDTEVFEAFSGSQYMFRAKLEASDYIMYFYVLRSDTSDAYDCDVLLLFYPSEVRSTALEKKLTACFDEAARTLTVS
ncbi:MAG: hypothetical protein IJ251_08710 [Oscillospiraceae bacterium]|nr:hypothetical protein [Oscillospiraceae bacterium]